MTTAAAIAREDRLRYTGPERCSGDGQVRAAGDRYSTVIWLLGGNLLVRSAGFGYPGSPGRTRTSNQIGRAHV